MSHGPIIAANDTMNQSELDSNTCTRQQVRENASEQVTVVFCFTSNSKSKSKLLTVQPPMRYV